MTEFPILNLKNWTRLLDSGGCLVMIVFETGWSDSAQRVLEVADKLFTQYRPELAVVRVQIDRDPDIGTLFGVTSVPYAVFTREAEVAGSVEGLQGYDVYERAVVSLLERTQAPV
jgi:thioredoxin-like negative regulator of GroEL